jgi:hypothetical protein
MHANLNEQIKVFLELQTNYYHRYPANIWLMDDKMQVYVRWGQHINNAGITFYSLDIANVEIFLEEDRGKGYFVAFLEELEAWFTGNIYIENVLNERLERFFASRKGYERMIGSNPPCFLRRES